MSKIVIAGNDPEKLGEELERQGGTVQYAEGTADRPALEDAGILEANVLVITDVGLATSVTVALDMNPDLRTVFYTRDSVPEFVKGQVGHIIDPTLLGVETVAEELLR